MTKDIFIVIRQPDADGNYGTEGFDRGWLLRSEPCTLADALKALQWQDDGHTDMRQFILCKRVKDLPGIFEHKPEGTLRPVLIERGPYTKEAYRNQVLSIWGGEQS